MISASTVIAILITLAVIGFFCVWYMYPGKARLGKKLPKASEEKCLHALAAGDTKGAFELYRVFVTANNSAVSAYIALGTLCRLNREPERAYHLFETLLMRGGLQEETLSLILSELIRLARITGKALGIERCLQYIKKSYSGEEIPYLEALLLTDKGELDLAIKKYERYAKISGKSVSKEIVFLLAAQAEKSEQNAYKYLKQAVKTDAYSHKACFLLLKHVFETKQEQASALKLAGEIVDKALMRTKEDLRLLEDVYYTYSEFDRLKNTLLSNAAQGGTNPTVYIFLESYYKKTGDCETAREVLRGALIERKAAVVIKKAYAKLIKDEALSVLFAEESLYKCAECGALYEEYLHICSVCGGMETVNYN